MRQTATPDTGASCHQKASNLVIGRDKEAQINESINFRLRQGDKFAWACTAKFTRVDITVQDHTVLFVLCGCRNGATATDVSN